MVCKRSASPVWRMRFRSDMDYGSNTNTHPFFRIKGISDVFAGCNINKSKQKNASYMTIIANAYNAKIR